MNEYEIGVGIVAGLALLSWIVSLEIRIRSAVNKAIMAKQAETDAKISSVVHVLSDAERVALAGSAVDRYSKD